VSDSEDPPRLSQDSASEPLRRLSDLVERSRADVATDEQLQRLEAGLAPIIGPAGGHGPGGHGSPAGAGGGASVGAGAILKAAAATVAAAFAAGGVWLATSRAPAPPGHPTAPAATLAERAGAVAGATQPMERSAPPPAEPAAAPSGLDEAAKAAGVDAPRTRATVSEADLLGQAQASIASNPARALALAERHRQLFPHGVLVQEREVLAIEALERMGRRTEASRRADRFSKAFPGSAHRSKIETILRQR